MAKRSLSQTDYIEDSLYVIGVICIDSKAMGVHSFRGYKKDYLSQNLSELEEELIICPVCDGIMRNASAFEGNITCYLCSFNKTEAKSVNKVRDLVAKLGIKCPLLRECDWRGSISEAESHSHACRSALISCPLSCEDLVKRSEIEQHIKTDCSLRIIECQFCEKIFPNYEMVDHLDICLVRLIKCKCGYKVQRSKMDMHIETECPLVEVECPYAKYSCKIGNMHRKDLLAHKKEFYIEHQDMLEEESKRMNERCRKLENWTKHLEQENHELKRAIQTKRDTDGLDLKINCKTREYKLEAHEFKIAYNEFKCILSGIDPIRVSIKRLLFGPGTYGSLPLSECRLFIDPTIRFQEAYFEVFRFNLKFAGGTRECVLTLDKSIYSSYIQEDGTLIMRLYFS